MLKSDFNQEKATQMAAVLLAKRDGKMSVLALMKLMYFVEREALLRWGWSITDDSFVSMPWGMVLTATYDLTSASVTAYWGRFISPVRNHDVTLVMEPIIDELSQKELDLIDEIYSLYARYSKWQLSDLHHELPEWIDPHGSSIPVDFGDMLAKAGKNADEIREVADEMRAVALLDRLAP